MTDRQLLLSFDAPDPVSHKRDLVARMRAGKAAMAERCQQAASSIFRQAGVKIVDFHDGGLRGCANSTMRYVHTPKVRTRRSLQIAAHEAAHVFYRHDGNTPSHRKEYEAELWSFAAMREHGIAVPQKAVLRAKKYVAWKIRQAVVRGAKEICREAYRWCGDHIDSRVSEAVEAGDVKLTGKWKRKDGTTNHTTH